MPIWSTEGTYLGDRNLDVAQDDLRAGPVDPTFLVEFLCDTTRAATKTRKPHYTREGGWYQMMVDVDSSRRGFHADDLLSERSIDAEFLAIARDEEGFPLDQRCRKAADGDAGFRERKHAGAAFGPERDKNWWRDPRRIVRQLF